jgi:hypothetical protein
MPPLTISLARKIASYADGGLSTRVLDCQCGDGDALRTLARHWGCATYGLDDPLPGLSGIGTTQVLRSTLLSTRISNGSMSAVLVWLPDDRQSLAIRQPTALVQRAAGICQGGGLLVCIGSPVAFDQGVLTAALRRMDDVLLARSWPWATELVLIGQRTDGATGGLRPKDLLDRIAREAVAVLEDCPSARYRLLSMSGQLIFSPAALTCADALEAARREGVWTQERFRPVLVGAPARQVRPAMPLRRGHLGLLVAAGAFGTLLLRRDGRRLLLRGRAYKRTATAGDAERGRRVSTETFATDAAALDLQAARLHLLRAAEDADPQGD